ncbi:MAG: class I SAM-dependent methyltransferase [Gammaproteobacteria bacterium]|nr:class I SAM-dependent methyltransferase [Gammaproteobacteria bacterium]MCY4256564.1 class I SAM-dependent methyltransferase [Gammaproteobacteria bacterium]MCY4340947.1 class I SAM-dependent methyltransferase [Gammaproteobacteria bacterium]
MTDYVRHDLRIEPARDELSRQRFVSEMRRHILGDLAREMRSAYDKRVEPAIVREKGRTPEDGVEVHRGMRGERAYRFYSAMRVNCQKLVWRSVIPTIERNLKDLNRKVAATGANGGGHGGSLRLDPLVQTPSYVANHDVHLMPGCYHTEYGHGDAAAGALYDNGTAVFSMGLFGNERDDIGTSIARFVSLRFPQFHPLRILDMGCSIGSNTVPWAGAFPEAEVHAVDVAAPLLRYAHARAEVLGARVHYRQMDAAQCDFGSEPGFDIIWSSMFLHELPPKQVRAVFREAHRLLRPGGLMLHMELPPNCRTVPYESFYFDWDSYYNQEPYYKAFRDMRPIDCCAAAGFDESKFMEFIVPSLARNGEQELRDYVSRQDITVDENTGRLVPSIRWYCFGAWK